MSSSYPELVFRADDDFDEKRLNAAFEVVDARLRALEPFSPAWQTEIDQFRLFGLTRLNDAMQPVYDHLLSISQLGQAFTANSITAATVREGLLTLVLDESDRSLFAAAAYLGVQGDDYENYMSGPVVSYDRSTGTLLIDVKETSGSGTFSSWIISAVPSPAVQNSRFVQLRASFDAYAKGLGDQAATQMQGYLNAVTSKADINSPQFAGTPKAPTPPASDSSLRIATTEFLAKFGVRSDADQALSTAAQAQARKNIAAAVSGENRDITNLTGLTSALKAPGLVASSFVNGFAQLVARGAKYAVGFRNDDSDAYLVQTAVNNMDGSYNAFRPFSWSLSTGFVNIDGPGSGARFGGSLTVANALTVGGTASIAGYMTFGTGVRTGNDVVVTRGDNSGYVTFGSAGANYIGFDYSNLVIRSSNNLYISAASGTAFLNNSALWHAGNFNPATKATGDNVSVVGYNGGSTSRPYINGPPGYRDLVFSAESYVRSLDAGLWAGLGRMLYGRAPDDGLTVYAVNTPGDHFMRHYWNGSDVVTQVDGTGFALQRVGQSDERLKDVEGDLTVGEAAAFVRALRPSVYAFKQGLDGFGVLRGRRFGFIAQHLQKLRETLVRGFSTTSTEDGPGPEYLHLEQDTDVQIIAALTTTVQNLLDRIERLENASA